MPNTGHVSITASNESTIDAVNKANLSSNGIAVGATLAFNTIGYVPTNTLFNAMNTLLGTSLGTEQASSTSAKLTDTIVTAAGNVVVDADSTVAINAEVSNEATAALAAIANASGTSVSGILASNRVSSTVDASVDFASSTTIAANKTVSAGGSITVAAKDDASITADTTLLSVSSVTNDGGASLVNAVAATLMNDYDFSSKSGSKTIAFGDKVRVASTHTSGGVAATVYQYMGTSSTIDLNAADYSVYGLWKKVDAVNILPTGLNVTGTDSMAIGGLVVRNDLKSTVNSFINNTVLDSTGDATVSAESSQTLSATSDATATSSSTSAFGLVHCETSLE